MGALWSHEIYLKPAEELAPNTTVPRLGQISGRVEQACNRKGVSEQYHCRKIEGAAYWFANPELHEDPQFRRAFGEFGTMYKYGEREMVGYLYYHIKHLLEDEHPAIINAACKDFQDHFKLPEPN